MLFIIGLNRESVFFCSFLFLFFGGGVGGDLTHSCDPVDVSMERLERDVRVPPAACGGRKRLPDFDLFIYLLKIHFSSAQSFVLPTC